MAKIDWSDEAKYAFITFVRNARSEFGESTAKRWQKERKDIEWRLEHYPTSYTPEEHLSGRIVIYRRCHMMHRRFKLIYYYDKVEDCVHIIDIWDTRMDPKVLVRRIK